MTGDRTISLLVAVALVAGGCTATPDAASSPAALPSPQATLPPEKPGPGDHELALMQAGIKRDYLLHAPPSYQPGTPIPLVLAFHGRPGTSANIASSSKLSPYADEHGFLVAYPQGESRRWRATQDAGSEDVDFVRDLIDHLIATWGVDPKRVYVTGFSNGAEFSYRLAWELSDRIAAAAPVSGHFQRMPHWADKLPAGNTVSLLTVQGGADSGMSRMRASNDLWSTAAGCAEPQVTPFDNRNGTGRKSAAECANGGQHVIYTVDGIGHLWPLAEYLYPVDATQLMWEFFQMHPKR